MTTWLPARSGCRCLARLMCLQVRVMATARTPRNLRCLPKTIVSRGGVVHTVHVESVRGVCIYLDAAADASLQLGHIESSLLRRLQNSCKIARPMGGLARAKQHLADCSLQPLQMQAHACRHARVVYHLSKPHVYHEGRASTSKDHRGDVDAARMCCTTSLSCRFELLNSTMGPWTLQADLASELGGASKRGASAARRRTACTNCKRLAHALPVGTRMCFASNDRISKGSCVAFLVADMLHVLMESAGGTRRAPRGAGPWRPVAGNATDRSADLWVQRFANYR